MKFGVLIELMLRPELLVLCGHRVCLCMLKGGANHSWTVMTKG